jgi:ketose-bisphosphate aldolase
VENQNILEEFLKADKNKYAVPAFNFNDIWDMGAIIQAAEQEHSPVLLMAVPRVMNCINLKTGSAMVKEAARNASVPVFLHLDHCNDVSYCKACVDVGFPSVMIDASAMPLETNIQMVKEVCDYAHKKGSYVEAELGRVFGNNEEGVYEGEEYLIQVDEAIKLVKGTHVDYLAVGIGTAHGFYKGKPKINFERLEEINKVLDIPLVLHGGTGIPVPDFHRAIDSGINKVNIGAALRYAYIMSLKSQLINAEPTSHPLDIHALARDAIKEAVVNGIRSVKASGKV